MNFLSLLTDRSTGRGWLNPRAGIRGSVLAGTAWLLLPLGVLFYFNLDQTAYHVGFAEKEMLGNRLQRPLVAMLSTSSAAGAKAPIESFERMVREFGSQLGISPGTALTLANLDEQRRYGSPQATERWTKEIRGLVTKAGDASFLTLDPEMDSYYLADVSSVVVAQAVDRLNAITDLLQAHSGSRKLPDSARAQLAVLVALATQSDLERVQGDLETALVENAKADRGPSPSLRGKIQPVLAAYSDRTGALLELLRKLADGAELQSVPWRSAEAQARSSLLQLETAVASELDTVLRMRIESHSLYRAKVIAGTVLALVLAIVLLLRILNSFLRPLAAVVEHLEQISQKNLSHRLDQVDPERQDEIGQLARASRDVATSLTSVISSMRLGIEVLEASSSQLSANSSQMQRGVEDTAERAHSTAAAADEMSTNVQSISTAMEQTTSNLDRVASAAGEMSNNISGIAAQSDSARRTTAAVTRQAEQVLEQMRELTATATAIGQVTETIKVISSQTNLLALNASIEAARAGAAGKGFAVVANEIKDLAQQTADATGDIRSRIEAIQLSTLSGADEISRVADAVQGVRDLVETMATAIERQSEVTSQLSAHLAEAAQGTREANQRLAESASVAVEMAKDAAAVNRVTQQLAEGTGQIATRAEDMRLTAQQLTETVDQFAIHAG